MWDHPVVVEDEEKTRDRWRRPGSIDWPPTTLTRPPAAATAASKPLKHPRPPPPSLSLLPYFSFLCHVLPFPKIILNINWNVDSITFTILWKYSNRKIYFLFPL